MLLFGILFRRRSTFGNMRYEWKLQVRNRASQILWMTHFEMSTHYGSSCQNICCYHIFVGSPQLRCIPASLADNPYAHSSLFNKTMVKLIYYLLGSMLCSRKGLFSRDSQEI